MLNVFKECIFKYSVKCSSRSPAMCQGSLVAGSQPQSFILSLHGAVYCIDMSSKKFWSAKVASNDQLKLGHVSPSNLNLLLLLISSLAK